MEAACTANAHSSFLFSELPGASRLFIDLLYDFHRVSKFYDFDPSAPESLPQSAAAVNFPERRREAIAQILENQNGGSPSLERLRRPGAVAIVTGQQVGLFGGPCYVVYKALTAVVLARRLRDLGVNAVPIFWMATEDHDFAEVNHCWVFGKGNEPARLEITGPEMKNAPVGGIPIEKPPVDELRRALAGFPCAEEVLAAVHESYAPGQTFGSAFAALLRRIIGDPDLLFFDPMDPAARELAAPLIRRAIDRVSSLSSALLQRDRDLTQAGYHTQVRVVDGSSLLFLLQNGERLAIRRDGNEFVAGGRRMGAEELAGQCAALSPNALLRPVVQDYLFPTAAYIGGPAELAYFAQNQVVYRALDVRFPLVMPRASVTILDARAQNLLAKYGLQLPDLWRSQHLVREHLAQAFLPATLAREIGETRLAIARLFEIVSLERKGSSETLRWLATGKSKIQYQLSKVERRIAVDRMNAEQRLDGAVTSVCNLVYPSGHPQERFYAILPFLAQHGFEWIDRLKELLKSSIDKHQILRI
jgi:bacillithiol biosynthesis cysteine-adding enzyme BshC